MCPGGGGVCYSAAARSHAKASTTAFDCHRWAAVCSRCWAAADLAAARVMARAEWAATMSSWSGGERGESSSGSQVADDGI
jgi:hypothetical protein